MRTDTSAIRTESPGRRAARGGLALLAGVLLAAALALAAPPSAPAAAVNGKTISVRFPSQAGDASCVARNIELAYDTYTWKVGHGFGTLATQWPVWHTTQTLPWDVYEWKDCISHWGTGYLHTSYLSWDGYSIAAPSYIFYHEATSGSGVSTWFGSTLQRNSVAARG